jgi:hypothetical protein
MLKPSVSDLGAAEEKLLKTRQSLQVHKPGVGDFGAAEGNRNNTSIVIFLNRRAHFFKSGKRVRLSAPDRSQHQQ